LTLASVFVFRVGVL